ncbi:MAG: nucleotidyltransferase [Caldiserica bacterium]|nr:MAG: nucleotidyltransferase [Caldisericota bacterium]
MREEQVKYSIEKLDNAFKRLKEGVSEVKSELEKDGVIQRFEFTFELLWKCLKLYLEYKGIRVNTPRDSFKEAFRIGIIDDEENYLNMLEDRNKTSHIYDKKTADEIFDRIKDVYLKLIDGLVKKLKEEK